MKKKKMVTWVCKDCGDFCELRTIECNEKPCSCPFSEDGMEANWEKKEKKRKRRRKRIKEHS